MQNSYIQLSSLFRYLQQKGVQYATAANANWPECLEELNMQMTWGIFPFQSRILWFASNIVPEILSLCQEIAETNTFKIQMVRKHINLSVLSETGVWSGSSVQERVTNRPKYSCTLCTAVLLQNLYLKHKFKKFNVSRVKFDSRVGKTTLTTLQAKHRLYKQALKTGDKHSCCKISS